MASEWKTIVAIFKPHHHPDQSINCW